MDLGVTNIAVSPIDTFWSADEFNHWRREHRKRCGSHQRTGTRAAHEPIEGVGRKEYGRFEIYLHGVANELVEEAVEYGCSHTFFEALTHIRKNMP